MAATDFLSRYLSGPLPYVQRHITVNKIKHFFPSSSINEMIVSSVRSINLFVLLYKVVFESLVYKHLCSVV